MLLIAERLGDFEVITDVSSSFRAEQRLCYSYNGLFGGGTEFLECMSVAPARYIKIMIKRLGVLTLCEVEVFGTMNTGKHYQSALPISGYCC